MSTDHETSLVKKISRAVKSSKTSIGILTAFACGLLLVASSCSLSFDRNPRSHDQHLHNHYDEEQDYPDSNDRGRQKNRDDYEGYNQKNGLA